ncbi:MAG: DUF6125 family protein [Pseudomonadota bacterium]
MQNEETSDMTKLSREELLQFVGFFLGDVLVHYGMWFTESVKQLGIKNALEAEKGALQQYCPLALKRLAPHFGIELKDGLPTILASKSEDELLALIADIAKTWLAGDGLWFQAVEAQLGMKLAKAVNDSCWSHFAHMEAFKIKNYLGLPENSGLEGLEQALKLRIYSTINPYATSWDENGNLLFKMLECRVQTSRRRKGMPDYPCKSAGITEYTEFVKEIDPQVLVENLWCPPDPVPSESVCAWRFRIK